jgi:hypothetical protein
MTDLTAVIVAVLQCSTLFYCCNGNDRDDRRSVRVSMRVRASVTMLRWYVEFLCLWVSE